MKLAHERRTQTLVKLVVVALIGAEATALVAAPWSAPSGVFVTTALLFLPSLGCALLVKALSGRFVKIEEAALSTAWTPERFVVASTVATLVGVGGTVAVSHFVVDAPSGRHAIAGYVLAWSFAALVGNDVRSRVPLVGALRWSHALALVATSCGLVLGLVDVFIFPREHRHVHDALLVMTLVCFVVAVHASWTRRLRPWLCGGGFIVLCISSSVFAVASNPWEAIVRHYTSHQRVLVYARALLDRDGDGFSSALGGGDCDDDDADAFPLSIAGHDCLHWVQPREPRPSASASLSALPVATPRIVVLVTIDTFRCGFGGGQIAALRDACPVLTRLAREGRARFDAHTPFPLTTRAMTALQTGDLYASPTREALGEFHLASFFSRLGFRTTAVVTHPNIIADEAVRDSFDLVDQSLVPEATSQSGITAAAVTEHALRAVDAAQQPAFIWAHYFDPHAPYVTKSGEVLELESDVDAYAAEVARTDAAIGGLVDALAARPDRDQVFVLVTADHGEEFGEHGGRNHGASLYDEVTRVPVIAWSAGGGHRSFGDTLLPASTSGVAHYLVGLLQGAQSIKPGVPLLLRNQDPFDSEVAIVADGWKLIRHLRLGFDELYQLSDDPGEHVDRSTSDPERLEEMGRLLGDAYWMLERRRAHDLRAEPFMQPRPTG